MSFPLPRNPIKRNLTCCGFKKTEHEKDLRKELEETVNLLKSIHDPSSRDAFEKKRRNINDQLERLKLLPDCPCNGECKRYLCSRNDDPFSINKK